MTNRCLYAYRVSVKLFSYALFGVGALGLGLIVFPLTRLVSASREQFQARARRQVHCTFRFFIGIMERLRGMELRVSEREKFTQLGGKIIVANHPSLIDIVIIIALIPNADCVVRGRLVENPWVRWIVAQLYLPNNLDFAALTDSAKNTLAQGNCLIIFPEGTRTRRGEKIKLRRGAANLAIALNAPLMPTRIGGNDKYGLGKNEPLLAFNPQEKYLYELHLLAEISPEKYTTIPRPLAARRLTDEIKTALFG